MAVAKPFANQSSSKIELAPITAVKIIASRIVAKSTDIYSL